MLVLVTVNLFAGYTEGLYNWGHAFASLWDSTCHHVWMNSCPTPSVLPAPSAQCKPCLWSSYISASICGHKWQIKRTLIKSCQQKSHTLNLKYMQDSCWRLPFLPTSLQCHEENEMKTRIGTHATNSPCNIQAAGPSCFKGRERSTAGIGIYKALDLRSAL